jgi:hypothetical protein
MRRLGIALTLVLLGLLPLGCGGSSATTSTGGSSTAESNAPETNPSAAFIVKGGKNRVATFGKEAGAAEREAASAVLAQNLKARETEDWAGQCASLTAAHVKQMEELAAERSIGNRCPEGVGSEAEPIEGTEALRADTLSGSIAALRVEGDRGYALYHGDDGKNYAMAMRREGGHWKVASLTTINLPKPGG